MVDSYVFDRDARRSGPTIYFVVLQGLIKNLLEILFIHDQEGQEKIKINSLVVTCRRSHQVLKRLILQMLLAHIVHLHVELPLILLEK